MVARARRCRRCSSGSRSRLVREAGAAEGAGRRSGSRRSRRRALVAVADAVAAAGRGADAALALVALAVGVAVAARAAGAAQAGAAAAVDVALVAVERAVLAEVLRRGVAAPLAHGVRWSARANESASLTKLWRAGDQLPCPSPSWTSGAIEVLNQPEVLELVEAEDAVAIRVGAPEGARGTRSDWRRPSGPGHARRARRRRSPRTRPASCRRSRCRRRRARSAGRSPERSRDRRARRAARARSRSPEHAWSPRGSR